MKLRLHLHEKAECKKVYAQNRFRPPVWWMNNKLRAFVRQQINLVSISIPFFLLILQNS